MVNKLTLATLYLSALALAHPSNVRRQDDGAPEVPDLPEEPDVPEIPGPEDPEIPAPEDPEIPAPEDPEIPGEGPGKFRSHRLLEISLML